MSFKLAPFGFAKTFSLGIIALSAGVAAYMRNRLPDAPIATHFDAEGVANGFMPRDAALAFGPGLLIAVAATFWLLPKIMPNNSRLERSESAYSSIWVSLLGFLALVNGLIIAVAMGVAVDMNMAMGVGIGLLFIFMGNVLPKMRYNYVSGIRTPWTLSDERVWDKTHRLAGYLFMLGGMVLAAASLVLPNTYFMPVVLACSLVPALVSVVYSYFVARNIGAA